MQSFCHSSSLREALKAERQAGRTIGFVPTMGNLHAAHLALVELALQHCDVAVASIFVNRLQFGLNEDWDKYPRTLASDMEKLKSVGCHYLFHPDETEIYPNGMDGQTRVIVPEMSDILCGSSRPGHFEGVATVVTKLFNVVQPDVAVFGMKDFQQLAIIKRMVEDLCQPVKIIPGEIYREADGLAMSSRNTFITEQERPRANQLNKSLNWIVEQIEAGEREFASLEKAAKEQISAAGFRPDYVSVADAKSLYPAAHDADEIVVLGAMYTDAARLIDNVPVNIN